MKLYFFVSAVALVALSCPFATSAVSLRSVVASASGNGEDDSIANVFFQTSGKYVDTSGALMTKDEIKSKANDATIITPIYESSNGFVVPEDPASSFIKGQLDSIVGSTVDGGRRSGFVKYRIGGMDVDKWSSIDIADFDTAIHEAGNMVHGNKDGIYFAGEKIYKIEKIPANLEDDQDEEDHEDGDVNMVSVDRRNKRRYWYYYYDSYTSVDWTCRWCPDDDAAAYDESFAMVDGKSDPIFNQKSLDAIATKACEILANMGNMDFSHATECTAHVVSPEEVARELMGAVTASDNEVGVGTVSRAVSA